MTDDAPISDEERIACAGRVFGQEYAVARVKYDLSSYARQLLDALVRAERRIARLERALSGELTASGRAIVRIAELELERDRMRARADAAEAKLSGVLERVRALDDLCTTPPLEWSGDLDSVLSTLKWARREMRAAVPEAFADKEKP